MRRLLLAVLIAAGGAILGACSAAPSSSSSPGTYDLLACAAINNEVSGAYANETASQQSTRGQDMLKRAESANNPELVSEAKQLQSDANAANQKAVDSDLAHMAGTCSNMGIGPTSGSN